MPGASRAKSARDHGVGVAVAGRRLARRVRVGDGRLEREHRLGALIGAIEPRQRQQRRDVLR
jgi:hypothetical protein